MKRVRTCEQLLADLERESILSLALLEWHRVPWEPGVYVVYLGDEPFYIGGANKLRTRFLGDHLASGGKSTVRRKLGRIYLGQRATITCWHPPAIAGQIDDVLKKLSVRFLVGEDARAAEDQLRVQLNPPFNGRTNDEAIRHLLDLSG